MKARTVSSGAGAAVAVPTPRQMEKTGAREGRDTYRRFSLFSRGQQDPIPAVDDRRIPSAVHKAEGACRNEAARLAEACAAHALSLQQQVAADERTVEDLERKPLPNRERVLPSWIHIGVLVLLGFAEWIVNALAFAVFGGTNTQTYVVALVVAVVLPGCAAVVGSSWKQHRHEGLLLLALVAAVGLIAAVALIRQAYFYDVVNSILGLNLAPWLLTVIYVVINLAMFFGGVLVSYLHAESDPEGQQERRTLEEAQRRLAVNRAAQDGLRPRYRAQADDLSARLHALAWAYNAGNMRSRRRARDPQHRLQPVWVDAIDGLVVPMPDALLDAPNAGTRHDPVPETRSAGPHRADSTGSANASVLEAELGGLAHRVQPRTGNGNGNGRSRRDAAAADARRAVRPGRRETGTSTSTASVPIAITTYTSKEARK